jgi:hypothetical protein
MCDRIRELLLRRLWELDQQLMDVYDLRVTAGDPVEAEASILAEQLEIDRQLGHSVPLLAW